MKKAGIKRSGKKVAKNVRKKFLKPGNLKASETSPVLNTSDRDLKKSTISSDTKEEPAAGNSKSRNRKSSLSKIPKDAAVHFGNFYGLHENASPKSGDEGQPANNNANIDLKSSPKSEFTRQMVHKLERSAGTEEYARQVSALLEDTVEPANFRVNPLPSENSIPDGRQNPTGYPLWYKDPYKMPTSAKREYQLLKEKYGNINVGLKEKSKALVELSSEEEPDDDESFDESEEEEEVEVKANVDEPSKNISSARSSSSSADESVDESTTSYEPSDDEGDSFVSSEKEEETEDYETLDTVLRVQ